MGRVDILRKIPLFAGLADEDLAALADTLGKRVFGKGVIIFHKESPGETTYIIESGQVRIFALSESGQEISLRVYGPGEFFGELSMLDGQPRSAGAITMEETHVLTIHREDFMRMLERCPSLARGIITTLAARVRYTTQYAETLAFLDVDGRVASRLLDLARAHGVSTDEGTCIALQLTQSELASFVGATRERVNKVLRSFRDQGLIKLEGYTITLLDERGLKRRIIY